MSSSATRRNSGSRQSPLVSVVTATVPGREDYLAECEASIRGQTFQAWEHLILLDEDGDGCSATVNRLVAEAQGDWLFLLADDDLALPRCLDLHLRESDGADVVYGPPLVWGLHDPWWFFQSPPAIPSTALIRREMWDALGGYDETAVREEDRKLWVKALADNRVFKRLDEPTWVYRIHDSNKSLAQRRALQAA